MLIKHFLYHGECLQFCHAEEELIDAGSNGWFWKPSSARVELYDFKAHAEIPLNATAHYPIELNQIRARFLKQSEFLGARIHVIDNINEYNAWKSILTDQNDGTAISELPTTEIHKAYNNTQASYSLEYDDDNWVDKRIVDDEMFSFDWNGSGPWRQGNMFYCNLRYDKLDADKRTVRQFLSFERFDYLCGTLDEPNTTSYIDGVDIPLCDQINNCSFTNVFATWFQEYTSQIPAGAGFNDNTALNKFTERNGSNMEYIPFAATHGPRYQDDNIMKPILLDFSRFMNGVNIQPYRVYFKIRIIHKIHILGNLKLHRNAKSISSPMIQTTIPKVALGRFPMRIVTGTTLQRGKSVNSTQFRCNDYMFPIYNPKKYMTDIRQPT